MKRIITYFKPHIFKVILCLIIKITGVVIELFIPILLSYLLDEVVPKHGLKEIFFVGTLLILCALGGFIGNCKANQIAAKIAEKVTICLRYDLFEKIMSLSSKQIDEVKIPSLVARMTSDTYNVHELCAMILRLGVRAPVLLIGGLIASFILDPIVALVILVVLPLVVIVLYLISKFSLPLFKNVQRAIDNLVQTLRENMTGIRVIKALSKEEHEKKRFDRVNEEVINYELKSSMVIAYLNPLINTILNIGLVFVIVVVAVRVNNGYLLPGKVLSFTTFFSMILNAVIALNRMITVFSKAYASSIRIDYIFNISKDLNIVKDITYSTHFIEFKNVNFSYLEKKNNLTNISFYLEENQVLGIIGSTGSGKSTIINLLLRLYDTSEGEIFVNYQNIKSIENVKLKSLFGTSLQYDTLFAGSIKDNIDFYRNLKEEDIIKALKTAQADFVFNLKDGINTLISSKGHNLSGGQIQRIIIARALAGNSKILILDDAVSALDYKTEYNLRKAIKENYPNTCMIIVSSRISSIKDADKILVIDEGKICGLGTNESLMNESLVYQEIYNSQH